MNQSCLLIEAGWTFFYKQSAYIIIIIVDFEIIVSKLKWIVDKQINR